jgi:hypothetical protein
VQIAFQTILYTRDIYPAGALSTLYLHGIALFENSMAYGAPVQLARHPELVAYIQDMVMACKSDLERVRAYTGDEWR